MASSDTGDTERRRRRKPVVVGAVALVAVAAVGAGAIGLSGHGEEPEAAGSAAAPVETVAVVKTTLSDTQTLPGTLGFGAERPVRGAGTGVVTRLPKAGATVVRGRALYWMDDRPVPVFFGDTPLFRKLDKTGMQGRDVTVVADNLRALGYNVGITYSRVPLDRTKALEKGEAIVQGAVFTASLRAALKQWQLNSGLAPTGTLDVGQVVVLAGPVRIGSVKAQLGDAAAEELMTTTSTAKVVTVPVEATDMGAIHLEKRVTIVLPSSKRIAGKVTAIGKTAQGGGTDLSGQDGAPRLNVTVTPLKSSNVKTLDVAPVQVNVTAQVRRGVLAVPVGALLALSEGGYALQLPDGKLIAARTGMFARGMVEVKGTGITAGLKVVTSS